MRTCQQRKSSPPCRSPWTVLGKTVQIGASIGIAFFPDDTDGKDSLVTLADDALYATKAAGRNTYRMHTKPAEETD